MRIFILASLAGAAFIFADSSLAQSPGADRHFYVAADLGQTRMDQPDIVGITQTADEDSFSWSLKAGYRFNRYFALEGGYADLGEFNDRFRGACTMQFPSNCGGAGDTRTSVDGFLMNAVGSLPIAEHFQLMASAGAVYRKVEYSAPTSNIGPHFSSSEGMAWQVGIGLGVPINDRLEIGLHLVHFVDIGIDFDMSTGNLRTVDDGDATSVTLSLRWLF